MHIKSIASLLMLTFTAACSRVDTGPAFEATHALVSTRGVQKIHWKRGTEEDAQVDKHIKSLLQHNLSAEDAVQIALLNNRRLQATYESLSIAQADLVSAGLLKNPIFDAEVRFPHSGGGTGLEMALVQDFIDILYIPLRKRSAEAGLEAAKFRVASEVLTLATDARKAFYTLQASQQSLEMRQQVLAALEASYEISRRLRAAKNITELDLANERALFEQAKLNLRQAELQVLRSREKLNDILGLWGETTDWAIEPKLPDIPEEEVLFEGVERKSIEKSLMLAALRQDLEKAGATLGLAKPLGVFPDAEIGATSEREPEGEWATGPALSIPIPILNSGEPGIVSARAQLRRTSEMYAAEAVALRARVRTLHAGVVAARDEALYYQKILLPLRRQIVHQNQLQYNAMQIGPAQLLMAKEQQIETGERYIRSLLEYWLLRTDLDLLLNGGSVTGGESLSESPENMNGRETRGGH